ncbi:unnamed protein product [Macrosiphum euphorbiae]|uniref:F-box domain-containing protein n=1 Tax=Macrosiphum euphorbiae TaxID=13131 RepID=A0AAV0Y461_9HEMI|nr:unnamed protein product [Macrosiphum euphorbiae]
MENSNKRPLEDLCQYPHTEPKKSKAAQVTTITTHPKSSKAIVGFQDLPDKVIMHLFKYLSHDDIAKMALICPYLLRANHEWTVFEKPRLEDFEKSMEDIYLRYFNKDTTEFFLSYYDVNMFHDYSVSEKLLIQLPTKCPELLHLTLTNQVLDAGEISVKILPRKLKTLTIDNTTIENVPDSSSYLRDISKACPDLERIIMTNNDWVLPDCIRALSKLERLSYLSLAGCKHLYNCIPYRYINNITAFKSLQTLDLRFTPVSDRELACFKGLATLKNVFLESPENINYKIYETITDFGLEKLCSAYSAFRYPYLPNVLGYRLDQSCSIETLYVRKYPKVSDQFLKSSAIHCPYLKLLDIKGSGCTSAEIENFKANSPSTKVIY